jgi:EpsI family protein
MKARTSPVRRAVLGVAILAVGLGAQAALEEATRTTRPRLKADLKTIPMQLGEWSGRDETVDPDVLEKSQTDDYLNRVYDHPSRPGRPVRLWINYSVHGLNMRHSPEICLPGQGWTKIESQCRVLTISDGRGRSLPISKLAYARGELVQGLGFWYYIFGEGPLEHYVRRLPITSRSSHGRTTRGSGLTVEVFSDGEPDSDGTALEEFAGALLPELDRLLPDDRASYHIP